MRILIEFFDREPIANVLASCIFKPEIVVFLCDKRDSTFFKESAVYRLFKRRKMKTQPRFYYFDASDPVGIRRVLTAVVNDYPGCVFDFTGGRDLVLLVAGTCFAEMQLPGFYIDIAEGRFTNLRGCEAGAERFAMPVFSAEDIFAMTGATIQGHGHFNTDGVDERFEEDILNTFVVVLKNTKAWGEFVSWLQAVCSGTPATALEVEGARRMRQGNNTLYAAPILLERLYEIGVLSRLEITKNHVWLRFKSPLHRKCLLVEGIWLELYCYVLAKRSTSFDDVRTSVVVDWDGVAGGADNAKNEVDVFLVKGVVPVFISCKMSLPSPLALSEIHLLSHKFGGAQSRAVALTAGRLGENNKALRARAAELGIHLLDRSVLEDGSLAHRLKSIAGPPVVPDKPRLVNAGMLPKTPKKGNRR